MPQSMVALRFDFGGTTASAPRRQQRPQTVAVEVPVRQQRLERQTQQQAASDSWRWPASSVNRDSLPMGSTSATIFVVRPPHECPDARATSRRGAARDP